MKIFAHGLINEILVETQYLIEIELVQAGNLCQALPKHLWA